MLKIIAIDDNVSALHIIEKYAAKVSWINLIKSFTSPLQALNFLNDHPVDAVLIDVQMQDISGLEFIAIVKQKGMGILPTFIIVSAFDEYAIKGYDLNICDYLLKPYGFDRFLTALEKVRTVGKEEVRTINHTNLFVRQNNKHLRVEPATILYIESNGHTVKIHSAADTPLLVTETMSYMEALMKPYGFHRVHKQFLINRAYIKEIDFPFIVMEHSKQTIPIGKTYRTIVRYLSNNTLY
ncbi:LytR/AlgR family response regulator transcription factor [Catalinimonas niigatensis]|uniref:LytR/AlgR family response regulator transcription factor n=1 Tax=Catalinimonas niigatensis TaxID=1397264 RepID=UPI00266578C2|nr:LytTR family DNA-binding domain-containing protein [Catalinimonas niigatensis]WPP51759.1 LytTR family DNA-binding domain-containing protein [Catalinimonas niigatensis]